MINHNPICSCTNGLIGDPFVRCYPAPTRDEPPPTQVNPCFPSPCGLYAECRPNGNNPSCSCLPNYFGSPPNCRPECVVNSDCASDKACIAEKCRNPCEGSCGFNSGKKQFFQSNSLASKLIQFANCISNAECRVQNHIPSCTCRPHYTGDPFTQCVEIVERDEPPPTYNPCEPSPCGANAQCDNAICTCIKEYLGDPYVGCRPECTLNTECSPTKACINNKCIDPCIGTCGSEALCDVSNHVPSCSCPQGYSGDPFVACRRAPVIEYPQDPCNPSPCGANGLCRVSNGAAVCACQAGMIGTPPQCRPECVVSSECALQLACLGQKCRDPCPGTCGSNASKLKTSK